MRLVNYVIEGIATVGVRKDDDVIALSALAPELPRSVVGLLQAGPSALAAARTASDRATRSHCTPIADVSFLPPILAPGKIVCVGLNYREHRAEAGLTEAAKFPGMFHRVNTTLVGHGQPMLVPSVSEQFDFEGELLVVIGRRAHRVPAGDALAYIAGYSIFNDGSVRDYQVGKALAAGKNFDASGAFGPEIVTADELPPGATGLELITRLNGEVVQHNNTGNLIFDVAHVIELLSDIHTLEPGDIIATGTPSGVGAARKPPLWMKAGDVVEVEIERVGILRNPIADEPAAGGHVS